MPMKDNASLEQLARMLLRLSPDEREFLRSMLDGIASTEGGTSVAQDSVLQMFPDASRISVEDVAHPRKVAPRGDAAGLLEMFPSAARIGVG